MTMVAPGMAQIRSLAPVVGAVLDAWPDAQVGAVGPWDPPEGGASWLGPGAVSRS